MVTESILYLITSLPNLLLNNIGTINLNIPNDIFDGLNSIFNLLGFIFPISGLMVILSLSMSIKLFEIVWSLLLRIKSFIPSMGA